MNKTHFEIEKKNLKKLLNSGFVKNSITKKITK